MRKSVNWANHSGLDSGARLAAPSYLRAGEQAATGVWPYAQVCKLPIR